MKFCSSLLILLMLGPAQRLVGQGKDTLAAEPQMISVFPLGGGQGSRFMAEIRGSALDETFDVWFDCSGLEASVKSVQEIDLAAHKQDASGEEKKQPGHQVSLDVRIHTGTPIGAHVFRLISPRGLSNPLSIQVSSEPVIEEDETAIEPFDTMQEISLPVVVNGKVGEQGDVDYYSLEVAGGRELLFELGSGRGSFDPTLTLYEPTGSWFDPFRLTQLDYNDEPNSRLTKTSRLIYLFDRGGRYVVAVGGFAGQGGPDASYQLRAVPIDSSHSVEDKGWYTQRSAHSDGPGTWSERAFDRELNSQRLQELRSRTVSINEERQQAKAASKSKASGNQEQGHLHSAITLKSVQEEEPNDAPDEGQEIPIPTIVEGAIQYPGDLDHYKFRIEGQQALVFEIQTVNVQPAQFNPRLAVVGADGREWLTNVYRRKDFDLWIRSIEPKTIRTLEQEGDYYLQIRELTSRYGDARFTYRVLIRPQIPHVGEIQINEDRLNLVAGEAKKLTVVTEQEERFDGEIAVLVENLPPGVQALPAAELETDQGVPFKKIHSQRFVPVRNQVPLLFFACPDAPMTLRPHLARIRVLPVVHGFPGSPLMVREIPVMVVKTLQAPEKK
jgi:hypothetical protein